MRVRRGFGIARLVAAGLAAAEGVALLVLVGGQLVEVVSERAFAGVPVAVFFAACAAAVLWCARGLAVGESWSGGPLVATQLLLLALSWSYYPAYPLAALVVGTDAGVALVGLVLARSAVVADPVERDDEV